MKTLLLLIFIDLALENHASQTEDSSPCWPHNVSPSVFYFLKPGYYSIGSAENPVRFHSSAVQKIKFNTL